MKSALLLHGTYDTGKSNWFPWLTKELEVMGYRVWCPDLPNSSAPSVARYNNFIFQNKDWAFNNELVIVGHSSGAVAALGLLQELPESIVISKAILVGSFKDALGWDNLKELFSEPFDFPKIKRSAQSFIFIHSDNDPYCPLSGAEHLSRQLNGELVIVKGEKHFSISTTGEKYREFPLLLRYV